MKKQVRTICTIGVVGILAFASIASGSSGSGSDSTDATVKRTDSTAEETEATTEETEEAVDTSNGYGLTVTFDDLEITFGDSVNWVTLENQFSDHDGEEIIELPIHVKNIGDENNSLNVFYIKVFGSTGTEVEELGTYFDDSGVFYGGELRPDAEQDLALYFPYDGDGTYYVNLDNFTDDVELGFEITK